MVVLGNFSILTCDKGDDVAKLTETLLEGTNVSSFCAAVILIYFLGFVNIEFLETICPFIHSFHISLVPGHPHAESFQFRELAGWAMFVCECYF